MLLETNDGYARGTTSSCDASRPFAGCKLPTMRLYEVVEGWKKILHANIVQLREVFLTKDFDDDQPCTILSLANELGSRCSF
jgi:hypothetical protein